MLYWQIGHDYSLQGVQNVAGANFFTLVGQFMNWLFGSVLTFQLERDVFLREQANNLYSPGAYFLAKNMIETPVALLTPMVQLLVMYWGLDYVNFFQVYLVMAILCQCAMGIGLTISSIAPNVTTATTIAPAFTMPAILFGGLFANTDTMPKWLSWLQWISPIRYTNEMMAHSQYDGVHTSPPDFPAIFLEYSGFTIGFWKCFAIMCGLTLFWRIFSLVILKLQIKKVQ